MECSSMAQRDYSSYQKKIITNYYKNLDTIALTRLQELVGQLYLADTDKKKEMLWKRVEKAMEKLAVPDAIKENILRQKNVEILAKNLEEWLRNAS